MAKRKKGAQNLPILLIRPEPYRYLFRIDVRGPILLHDTTGLISADIGILAEPHGDEISDDFYFSSRHLNDLTDPQKIWSRGFALSLLYVGAYNLFNNSDEGAMAWIGTGRLLGLYDAQKSYAPIHIDRPNEIAPIYPFSQKIINQPFSPFDHAGHMTVGRLIYIARSNEDILNLLLQLGYGLGWINLYSILDTLQYYAVDAKPKLGKKKDETDFLAILALAGLSISDINNFTRTANNFGLLKVMARHGHRNFDLPKDPLQLSEAKKIIIRLCKAYIHFKHGINTGPMSLEKEISLGFDFRDDSF